MLKNIPGCISPELMYVLMRMGHGDEIILADADFPAETCSQRVIRADGHGLVTLLEAILPFLPLDPFVEKPVMIMAPVDSKAEEPANWQEYRNTIKKHEKRFRNFDYIERFNFYKRTKKAFAVVATGEPDGNLILKKGVVML